MKREKKLQEIYNLYQSLFSKYKKLEKGKLEDFLNLINLISLKDFIYLEKIFRKKRYDAFEIDIDLIKDRIFKNKTLKQEERILLTGLASFNRDGYFREDCVDSLARSNSGIEIPFLALRLKDNVGKIRKKAGKIILSKLKKSNLDTFIKSLEVFYKIKDLGKAEKLIMKIENELESEKINKLLFENLESKSPHLRKIIYKKLLKKDVKLSFLMESLKNETDPFYRLFLVKELLKKYSLDEVKVYKKYFEEDKCFRIRLLWIEFLFKNDFENTKELLKRNLLDKNIKVRKFSMENMDINFKDYYLNLLKTKTNIALSSLIEISKKEDIDLIKSFLFEENIKTVKLSLKGIAKLDLESNLKIYCRFLKNKTYSSTSRRIIEKNIEKFDSEKVFKIYKISEENLIRKNCLRILINTKKWDILYYLLNFIEDKDLEIRTLAFSQLELWKKKFNKTFIQITEKQRGNIKNKLLESKDLKEEEKIEFLFLIK